LAQVVDIHSWIKRPVEQFFNQTLGWMCLTAGAWAKDLPEGGVMMRNITTGSDRTGRGRRRTAVEENATSVFNARNTERLQI
jgi:hypothetical protein